MKNLIYISTIIVLVLSSCKQKEATSQKEETKSFSSIEHKIDSTNIKHIFNRALTEGKSYEWLRDLTKNIGGRLSGCLLYTSPSPRDA